MPFLYEDQITFEKSSSYFRSEEAPSRIYNYNQYTKLILLVCNPVTRAITQYTDEILSKNKNFEENDKQMAENFENTIFDEKGQIRMNLKNDELINPGRYIIHYKRWLKYFPKEQILVLNGDNLLKKPYEEVKMVEKFLNSSSYIQSQNFVYDKKKGFFCIKKNFNSTELDCIENFKKNFQPDISPNTITKLVKYFEPLDKQFFQLIKKEPFW
jgi:[heparan sulfate]-glucosamine 3-sulfotransferase 5